MEQFNDFYHTTDKKDEIVGSGRINAQSYFCCTVFQGNIPNKLSYYGNHRVRVNAREVLSTFFDDPRLYFVSSTNDTKPKKQPNKNICYHELLLTDSNRPDLQYLDIKDNPYLTMDLESDRFFVKKNNSGESFPVGNRVVPEYHWVNVQIDPEIDLNRVNPLWD